MTPPDQIIFELSELPPSPNDTHRMVWVQRSEVIRNWRHQGWALALSAARAAGHIDLPWERIQLSIRFYLPDYHRRDPGNLVASDGLKGLIDGIVDAGIIADDSLPIIAIYGPFDFEYRPKKPGLQVTVTRL